jgi:hypothetical protein
LHQLVLEQDPPFLSKAESSSKSDANFQMHQRVAAQTEFKAACFLFAIQNLATDK